MDNRYFEANSPLGSTFFRGETGSFIFARWFRCERCWNCDQSAGKRRAANDTRRRLG